MFFIWDKIFILNHWFFYMLGYTKWEYWFLTIITKRVQTVPLTKCLLGDDTVVPLAVLWKLTLLQFGIWKKSPVINELTQFLKQLSRNDWSIDLIAEHNLWESVCSKAGFWLVNLYFFAEWELNYFCLMPILWKWPKTTSTPLTTTLTTTPTTTHCSNNSSSSDITISNSSSNIKTLPYKRRDLILKSNDRFLHNLRNLT